MDLTGKVALVTGSTGDLGKRMVLRMARAGADVVVHDLPQVGERAKLLAAEAQALGREALVVLANVADAQEAERLLGEAAAWKGKLDILVNNAGITRDDLLFRMTDEQWQEVIDVNLSGVFYCLRAAARIMGKQQFGSIVNVSSVSGMMGNRGQCNYAAAKAGVIGLTMSAARELASRGVRVNAIAPGFIESAMTDKIPDNLKLMMLAMIPLQRRGTPEEVAEAVLFLASDASAYVTGQVLRIDGGLMMG